MSKRCARAMAVCNHRANHCFVLDATVVRTALYLEPHFGKA
jgi:hypothetical protein